jgi:glycosyltransferase involved in cell wall biosynthesis
MVLGTPVVTSRESSLPEIAGDAALLVDPYDADDIARAITTIVNDADLRAELSRRGRQQAAKFSVERYRERVAALYASLRWTAAPGVPADRGQRSPVPFLPATG